HHPLANTEQPADIEVFPRLRLDRLVRCHCQQHQVNAAHAGQHVFYEPLVPWNVNKADLQPAAEIKMRKSEVDGDAAPLLLLEAVRINPGERTYQRRLAMINVTCR